MCILPVDYYTKCGCRYPNNEQIAYCAERTRTIIKGRRPRNWLGGFLKDTKKESSCVLKEDDDAIAEFCKECTSRGPLFMKYKKSEWARQKMVLDHTHSPFYDYVDNNWFPANGISSRERKSHFWRCSRCTAADLKPHPMEKAKNNHELCCNWSDALREWNRYRGYAESPERSPIISPPVPPRPKERLEVANLPTYADWKPLPSPTHNSKPSSRPIHKPRIEQRQQRRYLGAIRPLNDYEDQQTRTLEQGHAAKYRPRPSTANQSHLETFATANMYERLNTTVLPQRPITSRESHSGSTLLRVPPNTPERLNSGPSVPSHRIAKPVQRPIPDILRPGYGGKDRQHSSRIQGHETSSSSFISINDQEVVQQAALGMERVSQARQESEFERRNRFRRELRIRGERLGGEERGRY
ncbi:hypothetical protein GLAREA_03036 [Glarea lozoyensis ATCC 20868]|uniref:Uncharacterized protein n=1 Tax=Glarea lozoyensis (strain ATCC 20868 / MF5171) TaxID=1116229 RepID=S3CKR3_GLAL2|nr:uncharacterized protein GLAREA_03036 [Glarea lozoyensis ATCC 20868]EPE27122.1 hypothetical protein GLAREA_03036 [Glarea lozoyensis ATCC 20868]